MVLVALDLVAAVLMFKLRLPQAAVVVGRDRGFWQGIRSGIGHSFSNKFVLGVLSISLVMNGMVLPLQYFIPVIATEVLKVGPALGGFIGAAEGIGTLVGAVIIGSRRSYTFHGRYFANGAMIVGVGVAAVAWSPWFLVSFLLLFSAGVGQSGFSTMQSTILLLSSPAEMCGRIGVPGTGQRAGPPHRRRGNRRHRLGLHHLHSHRHQRRRRPAADAASNDIDTPGQAANRELLQSSRRRRGGGQGWEVGQ